MLYPTELSSGDVPDSNRRPAESLPPLSLLSQRHSRSTSPGIGHTPRQCRAHRTGVVFQDDNPVPLDTVQAVLRIDALWASIRVAGTQPPATRARHPGTALYAVGNGSASQRKSLSSGVMPGCLGCEPAGFFKFLRSRTRKNKTPPDAASEGVRVPRKIGVADLPVGRPALDGQQFLARTAIAVIRERERCLATVERPQCRGYRDVEGMHHGNASCCESSV
jgi:hypothetical protein